MRSAINPDRARRLAVSASGIGLPFPSGAEGSLAAIRRLGSVQIDTISVVERAHHHVLWTRNPDYRPAHIDELEAEPRRIIEYWSHACAYLPVEDYRFCLPRMERIRVQGHEWFRAEKKAVALVRDRIRSEGPMRAQDFEGAKGRKGWWDWKPAKRALEYLFHSGELVAVGRRGFQKVYDLAERALPPGMDLRRPSEEEMAAHYLDRASQSLGVFAEDDVAYLRRDGLEGIGAELAARVEDGRLVRLLVGDDSRPRYATPELLRGRRVGPEGEGRLFVLSPFDPLLIDRKRAKRLFGIAYQLECYLPAERREFGYFALPLLYFGPEGDATLVGRVDAKAERRRGALVARRLSLDPPRLEGRGPSAMEFARAAARELARFAAFNGAETIEIERFESEDGRLERSLRAAVARHAPRPAPKGGAAGLPRSSRGR
jgi:uncharacterized protein